MKSPAQKRAMKLGSQIRTIRGCTAQLLNVVKDLGLEFSSKNTLIDMKTKLEARAHALYNKDINEL